MYCGYILFLYGLTASLTALGTIASRRGDLDSLSRGRVVLFFFLLASGSLSLVVAFRVYDVGGPAVRLLSAGAFLCSSAFLCLRRSIARSSDGDTVTNLVRFVWTIVVSIVVGLALVADVLKSPVR